MANSAESATSKLPILAISGTYLQTQFCYRATNTFPLPGPPTPHNEWDRSQV